MSITSNLMTLKKRKLILQGEEQRKLGCVRRQSLTRTLATITSEKPNIWRSSRGRSYILGVITGSPWEVSGGEVTGGATACISPTPASAVPLYYCLSRH